VYYLLKLSVSLITVFTEQDGLFFENNMPFVIHFFGEMEWFSSLQLTKLCLPGIMVHSGFRRSQLTAIAILTMHHVALLWNACLCEPRFAPRHVTVKNWSLLSVPSDSLLVSHGLRKISEMGWNSMHVDCDLKKNFRLTLDWSMICVEGKSRRVAPWIL